MFFTGQKRTSPLLQTLRAQGLILPTASDAFWLLASRRSRPALCVSRSASDPLNAARFPCIAPEGLVYITYS